MGTMESAHRKYNKTDRERHEPRVQTDRRGEKTREEGVCQERRAALFLLPLTIQDLIQSSESTLKGLVDLNDQDLH